MTSNATTSLECHGLVRAYGSKTAVDGLSLRVAAGEIYALVGPDGAGKTTTMRMLCGALRPDRGRVVAAGFDLATHLEEARARIGYLPQRFSLYGDLTVEENLRFFAEVRGVPGSVWRRRAGEVLEFVDMTEFAGRRAEALSGGMRQKLGLAAALVHRPPILLLDEPTGGVDPVTRQSFWALLLSLLRDGTAVALTTPYLDEASRCSRVGFMDEGRLFLEGRPGEIAQRLEGRLLEVAGEPRTLLEKAARDDPGVESVQTFGDRIHVRVARGGAEEVRERLALTASRAGAAGVRIRPIAAGLEDVFLEVLETKRMPGAARD
ncbi:MAG: ABC transporter ATP-binding protein [Anaerolineales bacterium]